MDNHSQTPAKIKKKGFIPVTEALPLRNQPVIAMTPLFRCLAILDSDGKWRVAGKSEEVADVIAWSPSDQEP